MSKEKYYFDILRPEYNLALYPGAPSRGKGKIVYLETRNKISKAASNRSPEIRVAQRIQIKDLLTKMVTVYPSIRAVAKTLNIDKRAVENYLHLKKIDPILGRYIPVKIGKPSIKINNIQKSNLK